MCETCRPLPLFPHRILGEVELGCDKIRPGDVLWEEACMLNGQFYWLTP